MAPGTGVASLTYSTEEETGLTRKLKTMKTGVEEVAEIATSMPRYSTPLQVACCLRVLGNYKGTLECLTPQDEVAVERTLFGFLQGALGQLEKPAKTETETPPALLATATFGSTRRRTRTESDACLVRVHVVLARINTS